MAGCGKIYIGNFEIKFNWILLDFFKIITISRIDKIFLTLSSQLLFIFIYHASI